MMHYFHLLNLDFTTETVLINTLEEHQKNISNNFSWSTIHFYRGHGELFENDLPANTIETKNLIQEESCPIKQLHNF